MDSEIRLHKTEHLGARNVTNSVPVDIVTSSKPLIRKDLKEVVDLYDVFRDEYSKCTQYRLTLTIKPFMTNVLFNMCTEVVKCEGIDIENIVPSTEQSKYYPVSDKPGANIVISGNFIYGWKGNSNDEHITRYYMVSNTEYSSPELGYDYLPGFDIFDNHTLRNLSFRPIMQVEKSTAKTRRVFNTIADIMRDRKGVPIEYNPRFSYADFGGSESMKMHVYNHVNLLPFYDGSSVNANLIVDNGWFGFINASAVTDSEKGSLCVNEAFGEHTYSHTINNRGNCEFIDMFPDRTRFSLMPKYNEYRNRYEKNWDIFLTYPWKNYYNHNIVRNLKTIDCNQDGDGKTFALMVMRVFRTRVSTNRETMVLRTFTKHGLSINDKIAVYLSKDCGKTYSRLPRVYTVDYLGDVDGNNDEYFFGISSKNFLNDVFFGEIENYFYEEVSTIGDCDKVVYGQIRDVPDLQEIENNFKLEVFRFEESTEISGFDYPNATFDAMPKTINVNMPPNIRVWDLGYNYMEWNPINLEYEDAEGANPQAEYGEWNTYTDDPTDYTYQSIRVKTYGYYERTSKKYKLLSDLNVDEVINSDRLFGKNQWNIRFARVMNDVESQYYVRQFRKLPNWKYSSEPLPEGVSSDEQRFLKFLTKNATNKNNGKMLEFDSEAYKLAFSKTIYGDDVAQVTFLDTIELGNLTDNLGRPVTEIYSTVVKKNKGYKVWYDFDDTNRLASGDETEYSRCFGSLTTGFEYLDLDTPFDRSKYGRQIKGYMSSATSIFRNDMVGVDDLPKTVEDWDETNTEKEITEADDVFFGDVVEYNPSECLERVLSDACFRFNTAQREIGNDDVDGDFNFVYHELSYDDMDPPTPDGDTNGIERTKPFLVTEYREWFSSNDVPPIQTPVDKEVGLVIMQNGYDERFPDRRITNGDGTPFTIRKNEGYFYKPHHKIQLLKFSDKVYQGSHRTLRVKECRPIQSNGMYIKVTTSTRHGVAVSDNLYVCNGDSWIEVSVVDWIDNYRFVMNPITKDDAERNGEPYKDWITMCDEINSGKIKIRVLNEEIPSYAEKIDENLFVWRNVVNPRDLPENDELKHPFSNNAFYVDSQVNLYLRRQDPEGINGLCLDGFGEIRGKILKESNNEYKTEREFTC